jgi:tetratricopeptide (TPR) repeat protein
VSSSGPDVPPPPAPPTPHPTPPPTPCPDCGAPNPAGAEECAECHHPLAPAGAESIARPIRRSPRDEPDRVPATVATWGYRPAGARGAGSNVPSWLWAAIGLFALGTVLATAIQIARAPKPLAVPNASKPQLASAESLAVLLRADSSAVGPNVALGNLLYDTGNFAMAVPYYRRALLADSSLIDVQVDLAVSYHNDGQSELAREVLEDAVRRRPDHAVAHFDLGVVYHQLGRREDARRALARARSLEGPEAMMAVIDQLLVRMSDSTATSSSDDGGLPPGHPPTGLPTNP